MSAEHGRLDESPRLPAVLLALATAAVYWRVCGYPFVGFDDNHYVTENAFVNAGLTWKGLRWAFTTDNANYWHPLAFVSHMLDVELSGLRAGFHHFTSAALHVVNVLLAFSLVRRLTGDIWRAAFAAAVFAVHPLQVEAVAWVAERKTVLATTFLLLSLRAYCARALGGGPGRYAWALAWYALSLAAKPLGVFLPGLLLVLEWRPIGGFARGSAAPLKRAAPFFALAAASCLATLRTAVYVSPQPLADRLRNVPVFLARYLGKAVWPSDYSVFYPYPSAPAAPEAWGWAAVLLLSLTAWALRERARRPLALTGWLWFLGALLPTAGLVAVGAHSIAERFAYFAVLGLGIAAAWAAPGPRAVRAGAAAACLCVLATVSGVRVLAWESGVRLFSQSLAAVPDDETLFTHLGYAFLEEEKLKEAEQALLISVRLKPRSLQALHYLGVVYAKQGRGAEAAAMFRAALAEKPESRMIRGNLESVEAGHPRQR
jgi:tetratricopeptide (TPR) repeat protein